MRLGELRANAKAYLDDMIELQGGNPSDEDYKAALKSVEGATRDLVVVARAEPMGRET